MGVLSDSARKAYKRGSRRAHIPEWFEPLAYVFGGVAAIVLVVLTFTADVPRPAGETASTAVPSPNTAGTLVITPEGVATLPTTDPGTASTVPSAEGVPLLDGGAVEVPAGSYAAAQAVAFALLTGDFSGVVLYPGQPQPILLNTWPDPAILGVVDVELFEDASVRFLLRVDPDGAGTEPARDVSLLLTGTGQGWAYLPG